MTKTWGVAQFYDLGSMQYLLESGAWLADGQLFDGAPLKLFELMAEADSQATQLPQDGQPHSVRFMVDPQGKVLTARRSKKPRPWA